MSFNVNWSSLELESFRGWTKDLLTNALNSGKRPNSLALEISIKDLNFGKVAPNFEILEIGELEKDRFRGIFKITYSGDFYLTLHTQVQANPLKIHSDNSIEKEISEDNFVTPRFLLSSNPFNLPLDLKLSDLKISGIGIIVFSKTKGLTLVFPNDPLDSIKVSSTFDTVQVLANFLQKQIENQIRDLFRETLPTLIHQFSLKYTSSFSNNDFINNLKDHLKDSTLNSTVESSDFESVSSGTISKLAQLYCSRQTLDLRTTGFKKVLQRNHLEKFKKHISPNLAHSLYSNLKLSVNGAVTQHNNSIPVDLLVNGDFQKQDEILREVSLIQSKSFYSGNSGRAKRRTIKVARKKEQKTPTFEAEGVKSTYISACSSGVGEIGDLELEVPLVTRPALKKEQHQPSRIYHPVPVKKSPVPDRFISTGHASPLSHNSSFVGSVGLGNPLFARSAKAISASPLKKETVLPRSITAVKQSLNRVDIETINHKLQLQLDSQSEKREKEHIYSEAPPPYYQGVRLGF